MINELHVLDFMSHVTELLPEGRTKEKTFSSFILLLLCIQQNLGLKSWQLFLLQECDRQWIYANVNCIAWVAFTLLRNHYISFVTVICFSFLNVIKESVKVSYFFPK